MANMITIKIDGQEFPLPEDIAKDDQLLRAALGPFIPWMANAQIDRTEKDGGISVSVVKRADWKGNSINVLNSLIAAPEERNPAVVLWSQLEERGDLSDPGVVLELEPIITEAMAAGEKDVAAVRASLQQLVDCASIPASRVAVGF